MSDYEEPYNSGKAKKRVKKSPPHECTVILIDVGVSMLGEFGGKPIIELAKESVDRIISRKIFAESPDEFIMVLFGSERTHNSFTEDENIFFCEEEMQKPRMDWLRLINKEIVASKEIEGDLVAGLIAALEFMRVHLEQSLDEKFTSCNILLITNNRNAGDCSSDERSEAVVNGMRTLQITFTVIGPSTSIHKPKKEDISQSTSLTGTCSQEMVKAEPSIRFLSDIVERCGGTMYSFSEALPILQRFVPRSTNIRAQKFYLELAENFKLPLQVFKKNQPADTKLSMEKISAVSNVKVKRERVYEKVVKNDLSFTSQPASSMVGICEEGSSKSKVLRKDDIVKGYKFGTTVIPFSEEDEHEYKWMQENRCMKLIQFSKQVQIQQCYLSGEGAYYCIPPREDEHGCTAISALVNAMMAEKVVAIVRFVFNAASYPKLLALFPRHSKKGVDMLVGIQIFFCEEFRCFKFPALKDICSELSSDIRSAVERLVSAMDLTKARFNPGTEEYEEDLRPRDVCNPKLQYLCEVLKHRALNPDSPLPQVKSGILVNMFEPRAELLERAREPLEYIKKHLPLLEVPARKKSTKDVKEENETDLPGFGTNNTSLPVNGKFIHQE